MGPAAMAPRRETPPSTGAKSEKDKDRKRVIKACDRCRLKKSKCDGHTPCNRCREDNSQCLFGERRKAVDKVYPKGFTDQLVCDQKRLVNCVHTMYEHLAGDQGEWGYPLVEKRSSEGQKYLIHDILDSMNLLTIFDREDTPEAFEEDPSETLKRFEERDAREREQEAQKEAKRRQEARNMDPSPIPPDRVDMQMYDVPMSRSASDNSVASFHGYPPANIPYNYEIPPYPPTPVGGLAPPTPGGTPPREGGARSSEGPFNVTFPTFGQPSSFNTSNAQPVGPLQVLSFNGFSPAPGMYTQPQGVLHGPQTYGQSQSSWASANGSRYDGHLPRLPVDVMNTGTTLVPNDESPMLATSSVLGQQRIWDPPPLQSGNDPNMGFEIENFGIENVGQDASRGFNMDHTFDT